MEDRDSRVNRRILSNVALLASTGTSDYQILTTYPSYIAKYGFKFIREIREVIREDKQSIERFTDKLKEELADIKPMKRNREVKEEELRKKIKIELEKLSDAEIDDYFKQANLTS